MSAIRIQWKSATAANTYQVWRATVASTGSATMIADNVEGTTYYDTGLSEGVTYYYWVKAKNHLGVSGFSSIFAVTTSPTPPSNLVATIMDPSQIVLTWGASTGGPYYEIFRNTSDDFSTATLLANNVTALTYTDTTGTPDTAYFYWVRGKTATSGGAVSDESNATIGYAAVAIPGAPSTIDASDDQIGEIDVTWSASSGASHYDVYRNTVNNSGTATLLGTSLTTSYTDSAPTAGVTYYFWVRARNYSGTSAFSASTTGVALGAPDTPANINASDDQVYLIEVDWVASSGATSYELYRNGSYLATITAPTLIYIDEAITVGVTYTYKVRAVNAAGASGFTGEDSGIAVLPDCNYTASGGDLGLDVTESCGYYTYRDVFFDANDVVPDRLQVFNNGTEIYDTGCVTGIHNTSLLFAPGTARYLVTAACSGGSGSSWDLSITVTS